MLRANYAIYSDASKQSKDKCTDLSSQPFDVIDPCTTVSVVPQLVD